MVLPHNCCDAAKKTEMRGFQRVILSIVLATYACMAHGYVLHVGNTTITPQATCNTDHKLWFQIGNETLCVPMTTEYATNALHVEYNNVVYSSCTGDCGGGGGGEWTIPETPDEPIVLPSSCTWTQTNSNAYLLSDGNQYFDTGVTLNSRNNIEVVVKVNNGKGARLFGSTSGSCHFDMSINNAGNLAVQIGSTGKSYTLTSAEQTGKNTYLTENVSNNKKKYYVNSRDLTNGGKQANACTSSTTMLVLKNNYPTSVNWALSGGVKLYRIRLWNSSGTLIHDFQPVAAGTDICGTTAATNAMWDSVTKKLYYPAGTSPMGYGVDE